MRLYTGDPFLAEELAQEAFFRLCRDWPKLEARQNRVGWVHTVAFNLAKSRFRRRKAKRRAQRRADDIAHVSEAGDAALPDTADVMAVREAVAALPEDHRAVIALRYYSQLSVDETAQTLDIPVGTVKTRTRRALATLRDAGLMADSLDPEDPTNETHQMLTLEAHS